MIDLFKIDFLRKFSQKLLTHNLYTKNNSFPEDCLNIF